MSRCLLFLLVTCTHFLSALPGSLSFCLPSSIDCRQQKTGSITKWSIDSLLNGSISSKESSVPPDVPFNGRQRLHQPSSVGNYLKDFHRDNNDQFDESITTSSGNDGGLGCTGSSELAQSLYSPSPSSTTTTLASDNDGTAFQYDDQEIDGNETLPRWVSRMFPPSTADESVIESVTLPKPGAIGMAPATTIPTTTTAPAHASVQVRNNERTWEKFFVRILKAESSCIENNNHHSKRDTTKSSMPDGNDEIKMVDSIHFLLSDPDNSPFIVRPIYGFLAPRGGASNACDDNKPYSDTVNVILEWNLQAYNNQAAADDLDMNVWWLVVGTEEETWYYEIDVV